MVTAEQAQWQTPAPLAVRGHAADEAGLLDVWALVRRRKWVLLFGVVAGLGLAVLYYFQATPIYESSVEILVMQKDSNLPARAEGDGYADRGNYGDLLATHIQILQSPRVIRQAIDRHGLDGLATFREQSQLSENFNPVKMISDNLQVRRGGEGQAKDARVLRAAFRGPSPDDCAAVLAALVESYQDFLGETFQDTSSEAVDLITRAKEDLESEVQREQAEYLAFREAAPLLTKDNARGGNIQDEHLLQLQRALTEVRIQKSEAEARLEILEQARFDEGGEGSRDLERLALLGAKDAERLTKMLSIARGGPASEAFLALQPMRSASADTEYQRYLSLVLRQRELLMDYGADHPDVRKVGEQINAIEQFLQSRNVPEAKEAPTYDTAQLLTALVQSLRNDVRDLEQRERDLERLLKREHEAARQLVAYELRNEMLRSTIDRKSDLYQAVVARLAEISLIKDYGGYVTELISPVERPTRAVAPRLILVVALGGILGLFCGAGLAWLIDTSDRTFRNPDEVRLALDSPIMAHLPLLTPDRKQAAIHGNGRAVDTTVAAWHRPKSRQAEAVRGLRTALYFSTRTGDRRVIQITSPNPRDGKTTIVANLAVSIAQSGKRVLLVDADLRNSRVHKVFGIDSRIGLSNVLGEEAEPADAIQQVGVDNLWLLPAGPHPPNPSELLTLPRFEQLLSVLREQYDYVLIDSPPMLAVSDPAVIAPLVDGVLLVVRIQKNGSPAAVQARRMLSSVGADVIGVSINDLGRDSQFGYGYYGSNYGYAYGYGNGNGKDHAEYYDETTRQSEVVPGHSRKGKNARA